MLVVKCPKVLKKLKKTIKQNFFGILPGFEVTAAYQHHFVGIKVEQALFSSPASVFGFVYPCRYVHSVQLVGTKV